MTEGSSYLDARPQGRRTVGLVVAVIFHIVLIYALYAGLGRKVLEVIKQPIETKIIEEVKPPPPPPPEAPPPPPKLAAPPPPFIPPPEIKVATPPPPSPIAAVVAEPPPAPVAPVIAKPAPVEAPPAPKPAPPPPPPPPPPRIRNDVKPSYVPPASEFEYPRQAAREGINGELIVHLTISPNGDVINAVVVQANPKRIFDKAAIAFAMKYKFPKTEAEFERDLPISAKIQD